MGGFCSSSSLLPALAQFHFAGGRIGGDGISYYVYTRSLAKDGDLDFTNEYTHYGWITRADIRIPTKTGLRRSIFAVGPGLVSIPFFLIGEAVGRAQATAGAAVDLSGYGDVHVHAVGLGGFLYGFAAVLLTHTLLRRHFSKDTALLAALLLWFATFLHWYMTQQPIMSHVSSACGAALILLVWDRGREARSAWGYLLFGLLLGFTMCLRWQNGVFLLLPGLELLRRAWREGLPFSKAVFFGGLLTLGTLVGASPQMVAWKILYGVFLLPAPPHGADFVRLDHPWILNTLFSSRHGLLSWTPVLWAGFLGFLPLLKRKPALAVPLLPALLVMTYVNMCSGDWWAGGSFSNRRFDCLLPVLALGLAAAIETLRRLVARKPELALAGLALPLVVWNGTLAEQVRLGLVPRDDTVDGPRLVGNAAALVSDAVGFPTTWPASWAFAWRTGLSPGQYDRLVGRYLLYRQNNRKGRIRTFVEDDRPMLGEGWGPVTRTGDAAYRTIGAARAPPRPPRRGRGSGAPGAGRGRERARPRDPARERGRGRPLPRRPRLGRARPAGAEGLLAPRAQRRGPGPRRGCPEGGRDGFRASPRRSGERGPAKPSSCGGGPAGLKAAHVLAKAGLGVTAARELVAPGRPGRLLRRAGRAHRELLPLHLPG